MEYALAIIMGYLLGSIPVSLLVARRYGVDLYTTGGRQPGRLERARAARAAARAPAFLGDAAKAFVAGLIGHALGDWWVAFAAVAAAMVGHALPVFARFRGGKARDDVRGRRLRALARWRRAWRSRCAGP